MAVLRYLSSSVRSLASFLGDAFDELGRSDITDLLMSNDDEYFSWGEMGSIYFVSYVAVGDVSGVDVLFAGIEGDYLSDYLKNYHKDNGLEIQVPGIRTNPDELPPIETAWKLSSRVKYWEPKYPIHSYPGFEPEPYFNVYWNVDMMDFQNVFFEIDTNMSYTIATFDFGDGNVIETTEKLVSHNYSNSNKVDVRITLDNGEVVVKNVNPGIDPNAPNTTAIYATVLEVSSTKPS